MQKQIHIYISGLLMNILHAGGKSPVQRSSFENTVGGLLPTLRFVGGLYNFSNFVTVFNVIHDDI